MESVVVTASSIRVRTAPWMSSLSIEEFREGSVFALASEEYQSKDWLGIVLDGRVAFVPRYAVALKQPPVPRAAVIETEAVHLAGALAPVVPVPTSTTTAPAATRTATAPAPTRTTPAPSVTVATRPAPVEPIAAPTVAPTPVPVSAAPPRPAAPAPPVVTERVAAKEPVRASEAPAASIPERPTLSAQRAGVNLTIGVLGSFTPIKPSGLTPMAHVAGLSFIGARYRSLGAYLAPEFGEGGGYRSTMLGGGLSFDLVSLRMLRLTAMGGYTTYSETPTAADTASAPVTRSLQGTSVGGMVSIPFLGPLRLAYRGQYVMAQAAGVPVQMTRHSVGLVF